MLLFSLLPAAQAAVLVGLGFSHWYGDTFGAPVGFTTPGVNLGVRLTPWLEVDPAYTLALQPLTVPGGEGLVGFGTVGLSLVRELEKDGQRLGIAAGPLGGIVHTPYGVGPVVGARLAAHYLIEVRPHVSLGPGFTARGVVYDLPGSDVPLYRLEESVLVAGHSDFQIDLDLVVGIF